MRIRQNPDKLPVEGTSLPAHSSFLVCQLNRSPWDDDKLFSQFLEKWDDSLNLNGNGSLAESTPVSHSRSEEEPMEVLFDYVENENPKTSPIILIEEDEQQQQIEDVLEPKQQQIESVFEPKTMSLDGGKLPLPPPPPPPPAAPVVTKKRGRPKKLSLPIQVAAIGSRGRDSRIPKKKNNDDNNPYAFYYYSGFGPSWGKRRGDNRSSNNTGAASNSVVTLENNSRGSSRNNNNNNVNEHDIMSEDGEDYARIVSGTNKKVSVVETIIVDEEIDYIDDDFDDDDDDDDVLQGVKRIRPRKPVKARSLKSLM